ncbi:MAG: asparagine synthase (glutamine-hydrolyzing) [Lentisphaerae bacterium]|nr:asparagine synthase (glutamine-hydrolyzing) [Lentisphaerota bacterium]
MCGIVGIIRWDGAEASDGEVQRMTDAVAHRGPDGQGIFVRGGVGLGHRRLAIIDPAGGHQPMSNEDGSVWITYNGEVYNFKEIRAELAGHGHRFATRCDTEVVVHAFEQWGSDCVRRFRGMFAFAAVNFRTREMLLARDHFGIKPLYYRKGGNYLAFASELAALRQVDDECPTGNIEAVEFFLRYQYVPQPISIYREIFKLPPAHLMTVQFDGRVSEPKRYWNVEFSPVDGVSDTEWEARAEAVIHESVNAHLVSDVPFGVFLSGGNDSTLVATEMSRILERPLTAFSIGFANESSELPYARQAARELGIHLESEVVEEHDISFLPDLVKHYGEPFGDNSCLPTWHVSRLARAHVPMVLSGDGGDEAFGGYPWYVHWISRDHAFKAAALKRDKRYHSAMLMAVMAACDKFMPRRRSLTDDWSGVMSLVPSDVRRRLWKKEFRHLVDMPCELYTTTGRRAMEYDRLAFAQYFDYQTYLPGVILTKVDVASMYHGLEVRTPLVDLRVVEFAATLPVEQRLRVERGAVATKSVIKRLLARRFGDAFVNRKKQGFCLPHRAWFQEGSPSLELAQEVLFSPTARIREFLDIAEIKRSMQRHKEQGRDFNTIWLALVLGLWLEQNREVGFG